MIRAVFLDASPLSLLTQRRGKSSEVDDCKQWLAALSLQGVHFYVPEIADYELRRELLRAKKAAGVTRLNALKTSARYLPLTTDAMLRAADLWAQVRQQGMPTADSKALDGDVILAAQVLTLNLPSSEVVVATANVGHLGRFVAADVWRNIRP